MKHRLPRTENAPVLAGVKATPFGWPAASLDPDSGRGPHAASGTPLHQSSKARSLRCQRIAGQAASAGGRLLTRLNGTVAFERSHHVCAGRSPVPCHVWRARRQVGLFPDACGHSEVLLLRSTEEFAVRVV